MRIGESRLAPCERGQVHYRRFTLPPAGRVVDCWRQALLQGHNAAYVSGLLARLTIGFLIFENIFPIY